MKFSEKLNYLFELVHAEGKELAANMNITPPQISKMRQGVRGLPKNEESARMIANFFAKRIKSDFQREELAEKLRVARISTISNEKDMTGVLLDWLSTEQAPDEYASQRADDFLRKFGSLYSQDIEEKDSDKVFNSGQSSFLAYYGGEGKRLAVRTFFEYLQHFRKEFTIYILSDENAAWITEDSCFSSEIQDKMLQLTSIGCKFVRIAGPHTDMDQAFESLQRWFPLYMTGKATSYIYKRLRDGLNRVTVFVVPNVAVLFSFSIGNTPLKDAVTFFTSDIRTVNSMKAEFDTYFSMCEPIMKVFNAENSYKQLHNCMIDFESYRGETIQKCNSLSFITLPWNIAMSMSSDNHAEEKEEFLNAFALRYKKFLTNIESKCFYDIIHLEDIDKILNEHVPIPACCVLSSKVQYYTVDGYVSHLKSILFLLESKINYHVILQLGDEREDTVICVKEGHSAILSGNKTPFAIYEISERNLVDVFMEYLRRKLPDKCDTNQYRDEVILQIQSLINLIMKNRNKL